MHSAQPHNKQVSRVDNYIKFVLLFPTFKIAQ